MYLTFLITIGLIMLVLVYFTAMQFFNILFRGYAPFISTEQEVIDKIVAEINIKPEANVYELGCGMAGFLESMRKKFPNAKLTGVEYSFLPYLMAQIQASLKGTNIKIIKKNLYKTDVTDVDLIYCYLNIEMMEDLRKKLKFECKRHAIIVSYKFTLPGHTPIRVMEFQDRKKPPKYPKLERFISKFNKQKKVATIHRVYVYEIC